MNKITIYLIQYVTLVFAATIHECAHAWMGYKLGDPTAKIKGRLTLNPIPHMDILGTVIFPIFLILSQSGFLVAWAKPVPYNPYNLRNPRKDSMLIAAAGPLSNIFCAIVAIVIFIILKRVGPGSIVEILATIIFNLILWNIFLAVFNLIPAYPLDGSGIVEGLLKGEALENFRKTRPYGFIIVIVLFFTGILGMIFRPILSMVMLILRSG